MKDHAEAMVLASFAGDALALGAHWIYDPERISREFGRVAELQTPRPDSYHRTKRKGQFTHYGDQTFVLIESLAACRGFDLSDFAARWRALFRGYTGYIDKATRGTLRNFAEGAGPASAASPSDDLAGAARIAPLIFWLRNDPKALSAAVRSQTAMTHGNPLIADAAAYFADAALLILGGRTPMAALEAAAAGPFSRSPLAAWIQAGIARREEESVEALGAFGRSCHVSEAFPGVVQIVARHENDLAGALIDNVMAGGDSAARGMIVGMLLGAHQGEQAIPPSWLSEMERTAAIRALLAGGADPR